MGVGVPGPLYPFERFRRNGSVWTEKLDALEFSPIGRGTSGIPFIILHRGNQIGCHRAVAADDSGVLVLP